MTIPCSSRIVDVAVYGRGAVVTRAVELPDPLPAGPVDLEVSGLTPLSEAGSVRVVLSAPDRTLLSLQSSLFVPEETMEPGPSVSRVRELAQTLERLDRERAALVRQRERLGDMHPAIKVRRLLRNPCKSAEQGLLVSGVIDDILAELDDRIRDLGVRVENCQRARRAATIADQQEGSSARMGKGHPSRRVRVRLGGRGPVESLRMTYVVMAARWWPVYTLRLGSEGAEASWWIEGLVAQRSGEDWADVRLSLSTASLTADVRLPELPALRIGREQRPPRRAYRSPPPDLDRMFAGFDEAFPASKAWEEPAPSLDAFGGMDDGMSDYAADEDLPEVEEVYEQETKKRKRQVRSRAAAAPMPPPTAAPMPVRASMGAEAVPEPKAAVLSTMGVPDFAAADEPGGAGAAPQQGGPPPPDEIEPEDAWLDFDGLRLAAGHDAARRGRLFRLPDPAVVDQRRRASRDLESLDPGRGVRDPVESRGSFDHRYETEGVADVPSDGRPHRVAVDSARTTCRTHYRTVPAEVPEVFREASLDNPFDAPILDGPVDVYVDGSLLASTEVTRIDRGGTLRVGLGAEDRIRVARNVRVDEETTGLLGGTSTITHTVRIEVRSSLGRTTKVEVLDRIPDTDDRNVEVRFLHASHSANRYTQEDRGHPIRGGLSWSLDLAAGGDESLTYTYRIELPSKYEVVGGNRRD